MKIKDKQLVELLNKKKKVVEELGIDASKRLDEATKEYIKLKEQEKEIQAKLKEEQDKLNKDPKYLQAVKDENKATQQVNEITAKIHNIIWKNYLERLADNENFGQIKVVSDEEVDIEVINESERHLETFKKQKKDIIEKAKTGKVK
jgi:hypothetical protein